MSSQISSPARLYIQKFNSVEAIASNNEAIMIGLLGAIGSHLEIARQLRLLLNEAFVNKGRKQTFKISIQRHFRARFSGFALKIKLNNVTVIELGTSQETNSKGKVVEAPDTAPETTEKEAVLTASIKSKESDISGLKSTVEQGRKELSATKKQANEQASTDAETIAELRLEVSRLQKETTATEAVYQRVKESILDKKTTRKALIAMVG